MSEDQAVYFCAEADKKLSPGLFGKVFGSKTGRFEDAAALYVKAGNIYRTNNKGMHAGECYGKAAQCLSKIGNQHEAAQQFVEAARCSKTSNFEQSIAHFREAVHIFCELGRFSPAAKHMKTIAELYDDNSVFEEAVEAYQTAANYFETNDAQSSANQCLGKIALISGNLERYDQAIPIFEKLGFDALEKDILKMSAKGHFLHALFCMLAKDVSRNNYLILIAANFCFVHFFFVCSGHCFGPKQIG
eukprot:TRINITY_DN3369_c0_g1_i1.p1 TRINITY_DN3369_c0_g1~~TRINITY_DN3369_c0_g1_i1.p1  ORF type:complete len:246 (+),score=65.98 TRINITY_DN3369_c0_g1_i1:46-783(+)